MIGGHQFDGRSANPGDVLLKMAPKLADGLVRVQQRPGRMGAESDDDFRGDYFNLSLKIRKAAYDFLGPRIAIIRRAAF